MQGNIDVSANFDVRNLLNLNYAMKSLIYIFQLQKLTTRYSIDQKSNSTLQDLILLEKSTEEDLIAIDALMWLRRYLNVSVQILFKYAYLYVTFLFSC